MTFWSLILLGFLFALVVQVVRSLRPPRTPAPEKFMVGDLTLDALRFYSGYDIMRPLLVAIKGQLYDVTNAYDVYGPGRCTCVLVCTWGMHAAYNCPSTLEHT